MKILPKSKAARIRLALLTSVLAGIVGYLLIYPIYIAKAAKLQPGDLVFQSLPDSLDLVRAIEGCSRSPYSHVGIVVEKDGELQVLEAMAPVKYTPISRWILQGRGLKMAVYRFKPEHRQHIPALIKGCEQYLGSGYDSRYMLSKDLIYCSELIFHPWQDITGKDLGKLQKLGDLNWKPYVETIKKYEDSENLPLDRLMITPYEMSQAPELEKVYDNGCENNRKY